MIDYTNTAHDFKHLTSARMKILQVARYGGGQDDILLPDEAHDLRGFLQNFRIDNVTRKKWVAGKAREISFDITVEFEMPGDVDVDIVRDFMIVVAACDNGEPTQATKEQAGHFLRYMIHLGKESEFLFGLQRDTLAHEREMVSK